MGMCTQQETVYKSNLGLMNVNKGICVCFMSQLSSDELFHFTQNLESLKSILKNGFYPHVVKEDLSFIERLAKESLRQRSVLGA